MGRYIGQVSVFVCVCVCPKSNRINVLNCVLKQGGTILDKCLLSFVSTCMFYMHVLFCP